MTSTRHVREMEEDEEEEEDDELRPRPKSKSKRVGFSASWNRYMSCRAGQEYFECT